MRHRILAAVVGLGLAFQAQAVPFQSMDPRTLGMGGAAVAAASSAGAPFYNPALLAAAREEEDFALELPVAGFEANDPDRLRDDIQAFNDNRYVTRYADSIRRLNDELNRTPPDLARIRAAAQATVDSGNALLEGLRSLTEKPLMITLNGGAILGVPSRRMGSALYLNGWGAMAAIGRMSDADYQAAKDSLDQAQQLVNVNSLADLANVSPVDDPTPDFTSAIEFQALVVAEVGLALARETDWLGGLALGLTPKLQQARVTDYRFEASGLDQAQLQWQDNERVYENFNLDAGLSKPLGQAWSVALAVRDLLPQSYETALGRTVELAPRWRAGLARKTARTTLAVDLDLTENASVAFERPSRYLSLGGEVDLWRTLLLRLGYRYDLAGNNDPLYTVGLGLSLFGLHLEVGAGVGENAVAVAAQTGFRF